MEKIESLLQNLLLLEGELQKRLETVPLEQDGFFSAIVNNFPNFIMVIQDSKCIFANPAALKQLGYSMLENVKGKHWNSFFNEITDSLPNKIPSIQTHANIVTSNGDSMSIEVLPVRFNFQGKDIVLVVGYPLFTTDKTSNTEDPLNASSFILHLNHKRKLFAEIEEEFNRIQQSGIPENFKKISELIKTYNKTANDWDALKKDLELQYPSFLKRIHKIYPSLTLSDLKLCACIKMNLTTLQTARLFDVKKASIQMARVRLKKKLKLQESVILQNFIKEY
jgi:PAS domain S-box-containing protein